jgi:tetratricopeptide (TPR) repeat protein
MQRKGSWLWLASGAAIFVFATARFADFPRKFPDTEMEVTLPRFVQVVMTGGDRYLAANITLVRSLLNPLGDDSYEHYAAQAKIQTDAAWLNPRHEDNYYIAAAVLSWSGHVSEAEEILQQAVVSRPFDMLPAFYLGFDYFYFDRDSARGAQLMYEAANRADSEQNRIALTRIASRWTERGHDARDALRMVEVMILQAHGLSLKRYLQVRAERLRGLIALQDGAKRYRERTGKPPATLDDLRRAGILSKLPVDPQGLGYALDADGEPVLNQPPIRGAQPARKSP